MTFFAYNSVAVFNWILYILFHKSPSKIKIENVIKML